MKQKDTGNRLAWITWEIQVRNRSMSSALGAPLYELISDLPRIFKYPVLLAKTIGIIVNKRVKTVFVQNPSIVLSFIAVSLKPIMKLTVVVDAHNSGLYPLEGNSRLLNLIAKFIVRYASHTIVSNSYLADVVESWGGRPLVMPDPVPALHPDKAYKGICQRPYIFFICTWASDEPYLEVISAASRIGPDIDLYITGNFRKKLSEDEIKRLPPNIKLLGFIPHQDYVNLFSGALAALDLTNRDNCLVCGAYEAMALQVPCIVSDTRINREVFARGYIYVKNNSEDISVGLLDAIKDAGTLKVAITKQYNEHLTNTNLRVAQIKTAIGHEGRP